MESSSSLCTSVVDTHEHHHPATLVVLLDLSNEKRHHPATPHVIHARFRNAAPPLFGFV
uniref:Uncharacterized protein n=1 Tax=Cucumis sativus TaxID=3659 RepID=A0A0A0K6I6_CUCSA